MALQSSGAISLSQIQSEWGGSNPISLSEYYLGSLPTGRTNYGSIPSSGAIDFADFYGTNSALATWTSTMTVGLQAIAKINNYGFQTGFFNFGSLSDTTIDTFGNRTINSFSWSSLNTLSLNITNGPNSGWTSIKVNNTTFNRTAATFGNGSWVWSNTTSNPFGATVGATRTISFII